MSKPICDIPGLTPEAYAHWRSSPLGATTERLEHQLILDLAAPVRQCAVLDVGCGDGALAVAMAARGARVIGIDASSAMIGAARQRAACDSANLTFAVATADRLPFPSESFDVVVAVTILCFVHDATPVFREISRVLRPGGRLVIGELGKWSSWAATRRLRAWLGSALWRQGRFRTPGELSSLAGAAGLDVETIRGAVYYPRNALAARLLAPVDPVFARITPLGAAFLALCAIKPARAEYLARTAA